MFSSIVHSVAITAPMVLWPMQIPWSSKTRLDSALSCKISCTHVYYKVKADIPWHL